MRTRSNKLSSNTGIDLYNSIPQISFLDFNKKEFIFKEDNYILIFISNYCIHCIDLLPELSKIEAKYTSYQIVLFSTGDNQENNDIDEYFKWQFPIISLSEEEMEKYFKVTILPFCIILIRNVVNQKGVIYNFKDFELMFNTIEHNNK